MAVTPSPDLELAERIDEFWEEHWAEYLQSYPERFVAVKDGVVVAVCEDLAGLVSELERLGLSPVTDVWIEFVTSKTNALIL